MKKHIEKILVGLVVIITTTGVMANPYQSDEDGNKSKKDASYQDSIDYVDLGITVAEQFLPKAAGAVWTLIKPTPANMGADEPYRSQHSHEK